jgi:hypothetical protein
MADGQGQSWAGAPNAQEAADDGGDDGPDSVESDRPDTNEQ